MPHKRQCHSALLLKDGRIAAYPNPTEDDAGEADSGLAVYSAADGSLLWQKEEMAGVSVSRRGSIIRHTFVVGDTLFTPWAYDLRTGRERLLKTNPLTGEAERFRLCGQNFCGTVAAGQDLLTYRSASVGFEEISRDSGSFWLPEVRPSCWISVIPAGGVVLAPEGYSTCICPYNYKTSAALVPVEREEDWSIYLAGGLEDSKRARTAGAKARRKGKPAVPTEPPAERVRSLRLNLGAPGDRMDAEGRLWMALPRPIRQPVPHYIDSELPVDIEGVESRFHHNADHQTITGTQAPWLFTSGVEGPVAISVRLSDGKPYQYTVRLLFAETEDVEPGGRVFDVKIEGKTVLGQFDVAAQAGGTNRACVHEFQSTAAAGTMTIELVPVQGKPPRICSLAIMPETKGVPSEEIQKRLGIE